MYEMEEGGVKSGSDIGESSDWDDSDEVDRKNFLYMGVVKVKRRRNCCCWGLFYVFIIVGFGILVLVVWKLLIEKKVMV